MPQQNLIMFCNPNYLMTEKLYLKDSYLKEFSARVESITDGKFVVLDKTGFYAQGGGQPSDTGKLITADGKEFKVLFVKQFDIMLQQ